MQATTTLPQVLKEEKHTPHAVAFKVLDIAAPPMSGSSTGISSQESTPEIKKRLEAYSQQPSPPISGADIQQKLKRAEEKRRNFLMNRGGPVSPRVMEERRRNAREHMKSRDENSHMLRKKVEHDINSAE
jgi:hypothetical protein